MPWAAVVLEAAGFLIVISTIWLDEAIDLPHVLFGAVATPFRPQEAMFESGLVSLLGILTVAFTVSLLRRHFDRLIVLCAWCHRVHDGSVWVSVEDFLAAHDAETSHGICEDCAAQVEAGLAKAA